MAYALGRRRWHRSNRARRAPTVPTLTPKRQIDLKPRLCTLRLQHSRVDNELQVPPYFLLGQASGIHDVEAVRFHGHSFGSRRCRVNWT